jgi:hypothetical protein
MKYLQQKATEIKDKYAKNYKISTESKQTERDKFRFLQSFVLCNFSSTKHFSTMFGALYSYFIVTKDHCNVLVRCISDEQLYFGILAIPLH